MENKQTAVEYLTNELYSYLAEEELSLTIWDEISEKIAYAKSMEQKQIVDVFDEGLSYNMYAVGGIRYYNETYGK